MNDVAFVVDQLLQGYAGDPWHGPSTVALLAGVTAEEAAAHPVAGAHSIWELVLHMTAWQNEVRKRLAGKPATFPSEGDWRQPAECSADAWAAVRATWENPSRRCCRVLAPSWSPIWKARSERKALHSGA